MDQRRRYVQGGPGHSYQNGPRQQDGLDNVYNQHGPSRGQGRQNGPGNFRNGGDRMHSGRMDSRAQQNGSMEEREETLTENRIFPLERPSPMFPNAKWFCRLCHQHFNQMVTALEHCTMRIHARKKAALDLRKVVLAMPRTPEESHKLALEKELMNVYNAQKMTEKNLELREEILNEVSTYLQENLKKSDLKTDPKHLEFKLHMQGSSLSKLGLSSSDINMDLHLSQGGTPAVQAKIYFEILRILEEWPALTEFDAQLNLTIPMVKALHKSSNFSIEVLFGGVAPLKTNRLLQDYASMDERLAPLAVNFRYWAKQCSLDDPQKGFLPAHSFAIMTVFYLQQVSPPVLPCIHDSIKETEDDDYKRPEEQKDWKSENESSVGELWLGMLRFYAAEFPVKKLCVSIRSRKKSFLAQRRWPPRFIGIEDPYCKKRSLAKCIVSDLVMPYLLMCLRASYIYFAVPRFSEKQPLFDFPDLLKLDDVEDPEGDDIEDGLAADDEVAENEDDQEQEEEQDATTGADGVEVEVILDLRGWNQSWPENIQTQIRACDTLQYSMESVSALTGRSTPPVVCISCRNPGHRSNACPEAKLPEVVPVESHAFIDAQGVHSELCKYIYENFRPTISERELSARVRIVQEIEAFIQRSMPEAYLTLFGSSRNGFSLEKADLDICLKYKNKEGIDESMDVKDIIMGISRILEDHPDISDVQAIASAKVPIVKFHHDPFGVDGDISLYNVLAEHNTAMLKAYSLIDERVVHLGAAFKQYVKLCDMGDASRGSLSSYAYIVMLIHYLQKENVVPVLQALPPIGHPPGEELPEVMIDGWNAYYFNDIDQLKEVWPLLGSNTKTVGQLWLGLIDYYATKFRFDHHVVCIRQLEPLSRLEKMWTNKPLCVEDPFELDHNLGTGISAKMAKYIFSALITSRNWFLRTPERGFANPAAIYKHFMNLRELAVGKPPKDRGCKRCGKIGHWIKACPVKQGEASDKKSNRRVCHSCGKPGHIVKDCPTRLKQIRAPKDRATQQHHQQQQQQQHPNPSQYPMQQQQHDNRFPMKLFPSSPQSHPTIAQNDMTNSIGNSFVASRDGTSGMAQENKTVSEELGSDRRKKNKKSSKKKLAQTQRSQIAREVPSESLAADVPSVRRKTKEAELPQDETRSREEKRKEAAQEEEEQQQQRKKPRRVKRKGNKPDATQQQSQKSEVDVVASVSRTERKCSDDRRLEPQSSNRTDRQKSPLKRPVEKVVKKVIEFREETMPPHVIRSNVVTSQKTEETPKLFEFHFDIPDEIKDQGPASRPAKPKNQKKPRKKTNRTQISETAPENPQAEARKPPQVSNEIAKPLSVSGCDLKDLESGLPGTSGAEVPGGSQSCPSGSECPESEAKKSVLPGKEENPSRIRPRGSADGRSEVLAENSAETKTSDSVDKNPTGAKPPLGAPQGPEKEVEVLQTGEDLEEGLLDREETRRKDIDDSSEADPKSAQHHPKMSRRQLRNAKRMQTCRASEENGGFKSQGAAIDVPEDNHVLDNSSRAGKSLDIVNVSITESDHGITEPSTKEVRSKAARKKNKKSRKASAPLQSCEVGVDDVVDVCEKEKSEVVPLDESQTVKEGPQRYEERDERSAEDSCQNGEAGSQEQCVEEKPKAAEKSQKAAKRAKNKALRNARKKLERATALNLYRDGDSGSSGATPSATSTEAASCSTSSEKLDRPVSEEDRHDTAPAEQALAAEGDNLTRKGRKPRSSKEKK